MMTTAEQIPFQLILNSGNARSFAMEALQFAKQGKMAEADEAMVKAKEASMKRIISKQSSYNQKQEEKNRD